MQVTSATPRPATSPSTNQALSGFGSNFDSFLTLLTAQLRNQDPLAPLNATEFTTQLVQFTGVEQAIRQNQNLESMIALQRGAQMASAVSYLGKTIEARGDRLALIGGRADIGYRLETPAATATIHITDSAGRVVRTAPAQTAAGAHVFTWDGRGNDGVLQSDGAYTVRVVANDTAGRPVPLNTNITGTVTNVGMSDGNIVLTVGTARIPLADVLSVREPPRA
ncbi:MAG: flagellar hook assembly protein FlgD [Pseudomonadota bacterium]